MALPPPDDQEVEAHEALYASFGKLSAALVDCNNDLQKISYALLTWSYRALSDEAKAQRRETAIRELQEALEATSGD